MPIPAGFIAAQAATRLLNTDIGRLVLMGGVGLLILLVVSLFSAVALKETQERILARQDFAAPSGAQMAFTQYAAHFLSVQFYPDGTGSVAPDRLWVLANLTQMDETPEDFSMLVCSLAGYSGYGSFDSAVEAWGDAFERGRGDLFVAAMTVGTADLWGNESTAWLFRAAQQVHAKYCDARWYGVGTCWPGVERPLWSFGTHGEPVPRAGIVCAAPVFAAEWPEFDWGSDPAVEAPCPPFDALGTLDWDERWVLSSTW